MLRKHWPVCMKHKNYLVLFLALKRHPLQKKNTVESTTLVTPLHHSIVPKSRYIMTGLTRISMQSCQVSSVTVAQGFPSEYVTWKTVGLTWRGWLKAKGKQFTPNVERSTMDSPTCQALWLSAKNSYTATQCYMTRVVILTLSVHGSHVSY